MYPCGGIKSNPRPEYKPWHPCVEPFCNKRFYLVKQREFVPLQRIKQILHSYAHRVALQVSDGQTLFLLHLTCISMGQNPAV